MAVRLILNKSLAVSTFGAKTLAGAGGVDVGAASVTISSGNSSGHWQIVNTGGRYYVAPSSTGASAGLSASPYTLTLSDGQTVNIEAAANAASARTLAELKSRMQTSGLAYGDICYLRGTGDYSTDTKIIPVAFSGTWTPPVNYGSPSPTPTQYCKGWNLDSGNYVRIMPHPGESVTITNRLQLQNQATTGYGHVRVSGLIFNVTDAGAITHPTAGMLQFTGGTHWAADNNLFVALDSTSYGQEERRSGIYGTANGSFVLDYIAIHDNSGSDLWDGFAATGGSPQYYSVVGNSLWHTWNDDFKLPAGSFGRFCWNSSRDRLHASGAHADFMQTGASGVTSDISKRWCVGNIGVRGAGLAGVNDFEGLFSSDLGNATTSTNVWSQCVDVGNRFLVGYTNGASYTGYAGRTNVMCDGLVFRNNTILNDKTQDGVGMATYLTFTDGTTSNLDQKYNLMAGPGTADDVQVTRYSGYDTWFVGGQAMMGPGIGSTMSAIIANLNVVNGAPTHADGTKMGAHQDYFDYVNRTISLPYSLPTPP